MAGEWLSLIYIRAPPSSSCSLLASGSDDLDLRIWSPLDGKSVACMSTGHTGNIFSVKVMMCSSKLSPVLSMISIMVLLQYNSKITLLASRYHLPSVQLGHVYTVL